MLLDPVELDPSEIQQDKPVAPPKPEPVELDSSEISTPDLKDPQELVKRYATERGIDPGIAHRWATQESGYNQKAISPKGAIGVTQLMPNTAARLGVDPHDLQQNIEGGTRELRRLIDKYGGDQRMALAAYNAGEGAVDSHGGIPPYKETQDYVNTIAGKQAKPVEVDPSEITTKPIELDPSEFTVEQPEAAQPAQASPFTAANRPGFGHPAQSQSPFNAANRPGFAPPKPGSVPDVLSRLQSPTTGQEVGSVSGRPTATPHQGQGIQTPVGQRNNLYEVPEQTQARVKIERNSALMEAATAATPEARRAAIVKLAGYGPLSDEEKRTLGVGQNDALGYASSFGTGVADTGLSALGAVGRVLSTPGIPGTQGVGQSISDFADNRRKEVDALANVFNKENVSGHALNTAGRVAPQLLAAVAAAPETLAAKIAYWDATTAALGFGRGETPEQYIKEGLAATPMVVGSEAFAAVGESLAPAVAKALGNGPTTLFVSKQVPMMVSIFGNAPTQGMLVRVAGGDEQAATSAVALSVFMGLLHAKLPTDVEYGKAALENLRAADESAGNTRFADLTEKLADVANRTGEDPQAAEHFAARTVDEARRGGETAIRNLENIFKDVGELPPAEGPAAQDAQPGAPVVPSSPAGTPVTQPEQLTGNRAFWEMTKQEVQDRAGGAVAPEMLAQMHEDSVRDALARGEIVPPQVLAEFPELQSRSASSVAPESAAVPTQESTTAPEDQRLPGHKLLNDNGIIDAQIRQMTPEEVSQKLNKIRLGVEPATTPAESQAIDRQVQRLSKQGVKDFSPTETYGEEPVNDRRAESRGPDRRGEDRRQAEGLGPGGEERRIGPRRTQIKNMTLDEARQAAGISKKTGLPNYEVFHDDQQDMQQSHPHVGYADIDGFKAYNHILGHKGVDESVLPAVGAVFRESAAQEPEGSVKVYHRSGDEFLFRSDDPARVSRIVERANKVLDDMTFTYQTPGGKILTTKGLGFSHGTGSDEDEAEAAANLDKQVRKAAGLRTGERDIPDVGTGSATGEQVAQGNVTKRKDVSSEVKEEGNAVKPTENKGRVSTEHEGTEQRPAPPGNEPQVRRAKSEQNRRGDQLQGAGEKTEVKQPWQMTRKEFRNKYWVHFDLRPDPESRVDEMMKGIKSGWGSPDLNFEKRADLPERAPARGWSTSTGQDKAGNRAYVLPQSALKSNGRGFKPGTVPVATTVLQREGQSVHHRLIEEALERGDNVPEKVLAEYPDLQGKARKPDEESQNQGISPEVAENFKPLEAEVTRPDSVLRQHIDATISNPSVDNRTALHDAAVEELGHVEDPAVREQHAAAIVDEVVDRSESGDTEGRTEETEPESITYRYQAADTGKRGHHTVEGKPVTIPGFEQFDLYIYRTEGGKGLPDSWSVNEGTTGSRIAKAFSEEQAIEHATATLKKAGVDGFKKVIADWIEKHGTIKGYAPPAKRQPFKTPEKPVLPPDQRYYIASKTGTFEEVEGKRFTIPEHPDLDVFTHRSRSGQSWMASEGTTGHAITDYTPTIKDAKQEAAFTVERMGIDKFRSSIADTLEKNGGTPRYKSVDTRPKEPTIEPTEATNEPATTQTRPPRTNGKTPLGAKPTEQVPGTATPGRTKRGTTERPGESEGPVRRPSEQGSEPGTGEGAGVGRPHTTETGERPAGTVGEGTGERPDATGSRPVAEVIEETAPLGGYRPAAPKHAGDFYLDDPALITSGGAKTKLQRNIAAIRLVRNITAEGRPATAEEQKILAQFTGFGQFPAVFNQYAPEGKEYSKERDIILGKGDEPGLLEGPELAAAKRSTLNAHYTSPEVVKRMWDIARRLGFDGGRVLEPSMGIGNFFALMPRDLHGKSRLTGIELDQMTGQMARLLYPESNIQIKGFEKHNIPDNFYDFAIGNVPFGDYKINDKDYNRFQANIHDYFFLRSLDKVRPGGLLMFITSTGTLDKLDSKIRDALVDKADLVGAMRFPENTFQESAGTAVVTDLIILRKRLPDEKAKTDWTGLGELPDADGGELIKINKYYENHPEQILGTLDRRSRLYGKGSSHVTRTKDFVERFEKAVENLPKDVMSERPKNPVFEPNRLVDDGDTKQGGFAIKDGKLFVKEGDDLIEQSASPAEIARIQGMLDVRDALRKVINAQLEHQGETATAAARKELNKAYDQFVKKHGYLHEPANARAMMDDPDKYVLLALEDYNPETKKATKTAAFTQNTIRVYERPEKADNVGSAVGISLSEYGKVDIPRIAGLVGKSEAQVSKTLVKDGLAFQNPNGTWETADIYLSGNVRQKLAQAQEAAAVDKQFQPNVDALSKIQPEDLDYTDIDAKLGSPWIAPSDVAQFMADKLGGRPENYKVSYLVGQGQWMADYARRNSPLEFSEKARKVYGTPRANFIDIVQSALSDKPILIYDGSKETRVLNAQESADANAKVAEIKTLFKEWLWEDEERRTRLHRYYNDNFNNIRLVKYDARHYKDEDGQYRLPGMNPAISLRPHQANAIWQIISQGRALLAHEVGTGKTFAMVGAAMEMRRMGLANKPAIAVPKSIIEGFLADAQRLYPNAKIITPGAKFTKDTRKQTVARIATGDYDLVVLTHDNLDMLPMHPDVVRDFVNRELDELEAAIRASQAEDASKGNKVVKQLEKAKAKLEARLKEAVEGSKTDDAVYFEHTGVDFLFVDEAHKYKSLPVYSARQRVKGIPTSRSDRATNMLMRTRWLIEQNKNRGVVFATGTPVANTMVELYNMQKYLQYQDLVDRGIQAFDAWANTFGDTTTKMEVGVTGDYSAVTRFAKYSNLPELLALSRQIMDVQRVDDLGGTVVRPKRNDQVVSIPISDSQTAFMNDIKRRAVAIKNRKVEPKVDNMLKLSSDARKVSMDIRLVRGGREDAKNKAKAVAGEVLRLWKKQPTRTQMIFSDIGVNKTEWGFSMYDEITKLLVKGGMPKDKIIDFATLTEKQKTGAIERLATGKALVAIGGTDKLGTGVNAQKYLIALHHIDVPWLPAAVEQRDGRGWRQGNDLAQEGKPLQIYRYVTTNSFDTFMWQLVDAKSKFIRQAMQGDLKQRTFKDEDSEELSPAKVMAIASGNPDLLRKVQVDEDVQQLEASERRHTKAQNALKDSEKKLKREAQPYLDRIAKYEEEYETLKRKDDEKFSIDINGKRYDKREEAGKALETYLTTLPEDAHTKIGEFRGWDIIYQKGNAYLGKGKELGRNNYNFNLNIEDGESTISSIEHIPQSIKNRIKSTEASRQQGVADLEAVQKEIGKPFKQADELSAKKAEQIELERRLSEKRETPTDNIEAVPFDPFDGEEPLEFNTPESTEPDSKKYFLYNQGAGEFQEVKGAKPLEIPGFEDMDLYIHKTDDGWSIGEGRTGMLVGGGKTKQAAIADATKKLTNATPEKIKQLMAAAVEKQGESPRVKSRRGEPSGKSPIVAAPSLGGGSGKGTPILTKIKDWNKARIAAKPVAIKEPGGFRATFSDMFTRNGAKLRAENVEAFEAFIKAASSNAQSYNLMRKNVPAIEEAAKMKFSNFALHLIESRLRGIRQRYQDIADEVSIISDDDLVEAFNQDHGFADILDNIAGKRDLGDNLRAEAETLLSDGDLDGLRTFIYDKLLAAADAVGTIPFSPNYSFEKAIENEGFKKALEIYKEHFEKPLAENHVQNEGVFSDALGPLDTYYPLIAKNEDGELVGKGGAIPGQRAPLAKPRNIANRFATGLAEQYSAEAADLQDRIRQAFKGNNMAAFYQILEDEGITVPYKSGPTLPGYIKKDAGPYTRILKDGKTISVKARQVQVPEWLWREISPMIEQKIHGKSLPGRLFRKLTGLGLVGLLEPAIHSQNIVKTLTTSTPFIFKNPLQTTIGKTPILKALDIVANIVTNLPVLTKPIAAGVKILSTSTKSQKAMRNKRRLADAGALPEKTGSITFSKKIAEQTGAKRSLSMGPILYGPSGIDTRARLAMLDILDAMNPDATNAEIFDFVNNLGIYNRALEPQLGRFVKDLGIGPFYTAGSTRIRNGVRALTLQHDIPAAGGSGGGKGAGGGPKAGPGAEYTAGDRAAYVIAQALSGGIIGLLAMWVLLHYAYRKKFPWQEEDAKLLQIKLNDDDRKSDAANALYGKGDNGAYIGLDFSSHIPSATRALGMAGYFNTTQAGGTVGQSLEKGMADSISGLTQPLISAPGIHMGSVAIFGKEPRLTGMRDVEGNFGPQFAAAAPKHEPGWKQFSSNLANGILGVNGFLKNVAGVGGVGYEGQRDDDKTKTAKLMSLVVNLAAPGLIKGTSDVTDDSIRLALQRQNTDENATKPLRDQFIKQMRSGGDLDKLHDDIAAAYQAGKLRESDINQIYDKGSQGHTEERWKTLNGRNAIDVFVNHMTPEQQEKTVKLQQKNGDSVLGRRRAQYAESLPESQRDTDPLLMKLDKLWDDLLSKK